MRFADVVARSGGSLATLYALFGTKRGLFEAILRDYSEAVMRPLCVDGISTDPGQGLLAIGKRYLAVVLEPSMVAWSTPTAFNPSQAISCSPSWWSVS